MRAALRSGRREARGRRQAEGGLRGWAAQRLPTPRRRSTAARSPRRRGSPVSASRARRRGDAEPAARPRRRPPGSGAASGHAAPAPEAERRGWLSRLTSGLSRSSSAIGRGIVDIFTKRKLDAGLARRSRGHSDPGRSRHRPGDAHPRRRRQGALREGHRPRGGEAAARRGGRAHAGAGRQAARRSTRRRSRS